MMGYIFSRKYKKEFAIARASPSEVEKLDKKIHSFLEYIIFKNLEGRCKKWNNGTK